MKEEIENLNRPVTSKKVELGILQLPTRKSQGQDGSTGESYQTFKELTEIPHKLFQKIRRGNISSSFSEVRTALKSTLQKDITQTSITYEYKCKIPPCKIPAPCAKD